MHVGVQGQANQGRTRPGFGHGHRQGVQQLVGGYPQACGHGVVLLNEHRHVALAHNGIPCDQVNGEVAWLGFDLGELVGGSALADGGKGQGVIGRGQEVVDQLSWSDREGTHGFLPCLGFVGLGWCAGTHDKYL